MSRTSTTKLWKEARFCGPWVKSELLLPRHTGVSALDIWYQMQHKQEIMSPLKVSFTSFASLHRTCWFVVSDIELDGWKWGKRQRMEESFHWRCCFMVQSFHSTCFYQWRTPDCGTDHLQTLKVVSTEIWFWTLVAANSSAMSIEDVNNNITIHKFFLLLIQGRFCLQSSPYLALH